MRSVTMRMPGLPPTDNSTRRSHWGSKGAEVKAWRKMATVLAFASGRPKKPMERARATLHFTFTQNRRQGLDAYVGACKPIIDGIVDAGWIRDDGFTILTELHAWADVGPEAGVEVTLEELP